MSVIRSIWPLLLAAALLLSANGMQSTVLALRGIAEGFAPTTIGLLLSTYFVGFILGCRYAPRFIRAVGHIRAFTAFASIASGSALAHAIIVEPASWLVLRVITGFCFAALQMILESWLNESATNQTRGRILSIYRITDFTTVTAAQALITFFDPMSFRIFAITSIALSIALVPVALTRVEAPAIPASAKLDLKRLWSLSPVAAAAAFCVGLSASAFWSMGPSFVTDYGYEPSTAGYFIGAIILGGAIAQWPIGWLSDRVDRRKILILSSSGAAVMALILPTTAAMSEIMLLVGALGFGMFALTNFGLAVAHANDHADPGSSVSVNGSLLMLYGLAAIGGPIIVPQVMSNFGTASLFYWVTLVYCLLVLFTTYRLSQRGAPVQRDKYVPIPRTSPAVFELDPRAVTDEDDEPAPNPAAQTSG
jgi:MFS family permease